MTTAAHIDADAWTCPLPLRDSPAIVMGHGGGGKLSAELVEHLFLPAFDDPTLAQLADAAVFAPPAGRLAMTTDSFVVRPLFFPGGSIGDLAVNGTVNDLAMVGATPLCLTAAFILEEGLPMATLAGVVARMRDAARRAGVRIVAGDTKVVDRGHGDGCYITTAGIGVVPDGRSLSPAAARPGDAVLVSGTLGDHGTAILSVREGLEFETVIASDCAPLHGLAAALLAAAPGTRVMRDATRGGAAAVLSEIAGQSRVGVVLEEARIPVRPAVQGACELLGLDPLFVANEGKFVAIVPAEEADAALAALRADPLGADAARIGRVVADHPGMLVARTPIGMTRVVPLPIGEQLPRIC
ncbi:MAG: hydrogenase expression/formation protein HypE [Gemmatimonadales bacterium]|nr:hydrogenase expression/formation protein HypE [Gemmatimonadales bacterium]